MRSTARWLIVVTAFCTVLAFLFPPDAPRRLRSDANVTAQTVMAGLRALQQNRLAAYSVLRTREEWRRAPITSTPVRIGTGVDTSLAAVLRADLDSSVNQFAGLKSGERAQVVFWSPTDEDSTDAAEGQGELNRHRSAFARYGSGKVDQTRWESVRDVRSSISMRMRRAFLLPKATDGRVCVTGIALPRAQSEYVVRTIHEYLRRPRLLGPCAFVAQFGTPGRHISSWLDSTRFLFALESAWNTAPPIRPSRRPYGLELDGTSARCLTGSADLCLSAIGLGAPPPELRLGFAYVREARLAGAADYEERILSGYGTGERREFFLSDMVRDLGDDRFRRFWTSDEPMDVAFERAMGVPLGVWVSQWMQQTYFPVPTSPLPTGREALWWVGSMLALAMLLRKFIQR